ncbi:Uncharacterised protein [Clostridioides difficile]|nr:Uncharacterised protein [Clostridioides difficile]
MIGRAVRYINGRIQLLDEKSRIMKSNFVIALWLNHSMSKIRKIQAKKGKNNFVKMNYKIKDRAIKQMLKTNMLKVEIYKPEGKDEYSWLYVLSMEQEGLKFELVAPYNRFKETIEIPYYELEETNIHQDNFYIDGYLLKNYNYNWRSLNYANENVEKSRRKLIEKLKEISLDN